MVRPWPRSRRRSSGSPSSTARARSRASAAGGRLRSPLIHSRERVRSRRSTGAVSVNSMVASSPSASISFNTRCWSGTSRVISPSAPVWQAGPVRCRETSEVVTVAGLGRARTERALSAGVGARVCVNTRITSALLGKANLYPFGVSCHVGDGEKEVRRRRTRRRPTAGRCPVRGPRAVDGGCQCVANMPERSSPAMSSSPRRDSTSNRACGAASDSSPLSVILRERILSASSVAAGAV